jgi:predicted lactoylglutathione lyase
MRNIIATALLAVLFATSGKTQSTLGDVACVYITTTDMDSSAAVYNKLGFGITGTNTFPVPWTQVSDGSLMIMLRKDAVPYMGLTYYSDKVDEIAAQLEKNGVVVTKKPAEGDAIKRYYFKSPDGLNIMLASNLGGFKQPSGITIANMKPEDFSKPEKYPNRLCGVFGEFCHPVKDLASSLLYWKKLGYKVMYETPAPYPHAILTDGLMIIGLHQTNHFDYPAITYFGTGVQNNIRQLKEKGLTAFTASAGANNQVLTTWEKQHFFIFSMGM